LSPIRARVLKTILRSKGDDSKYIQPWDASQIPKELDLVLRRIQGGHILSHILPRRSNLKDTRSLEKELTELKSLIQTRWPESGDLTVKFLQDGSLEFQTHYTIEKALTLSEECQHELGSVMHSIPYQFKYLRELRLSSGYPEDQTLISPEEMPAFTEEIERILHDEGSTRVAKILSTKLKDMTVVIERAVEGGLCILIGRA